MAILLFDLGGSSVKYGVWNKDCIMDKNSFVTPDTWDNMKEFLLEIKKEMAAKYELEGVALSSPGVINQVAGVIEGTSSIPYIHHFPIVKELEELFKCPVSIENDANCAGLAELWKGAAKGLKDVIFVVVGSGIGGAVIIDGKIQYGKHLFAGEFGHMLLTDQHTFSDLGTAVNMAKRYAKHKNLEESAISGKEVFELAEQGDAIAQNEVDIFYRYLAQGIYNLQYSFDPEKIVIGGGVSSKSDLIQQLNINLKQIVKRVGIPHFIPEIVLCEFKNDANLIGAAYNYKTNRRHQGHK